MGNVVQTKMYFNVETNGSADTDVLSGNVKFVTGQNRDWYITGGESQNKVKS